MISLEPKTYSVALRWKRGEYGAISTLDDANKDRLLPQIILPPRTARDIEKDRPLTKKEVIAIQTGRLSKFWRGRPCLLDGRFLKFDERDVEDAAQFSRFLTEATKFGCAAIPVVDLRTSSHRLQVVATHLDSTKNQISLRLTINDLARENLGAKIQLLLSNVGQKPEHCVLVLDLSGAHLSVPKAFAAFIASQINKLLKYGTWQRIVVQATNYPEKNPAPNNGNYIVSRSEWIVWQELLKLDRDITKVAIFGDFGADNARMNFKGGGRPIPHFRYATKDTWVVARGEDDYGSIRAVARRIVGSDFFAGEMFSAGDEFIAACASGAGVAGGPSEWREANMNHHITQATISTADALALPIPKRVRRRTPVQEPLFNEPAHK
jgi:hypothetical protein